VYPVDTGSGTGTGGDTGLHIIPAPRAPLDITMRAPSAPALLTGPDAQSVHIYRLAVQAALLKVLKDAIQSGNLDPDWGHAVSQALLLAGQGAALSAGAGPYVAAIVAVVAFFAGLFDSVANTSRHTIGDQMSTMISKLDPILRYVLWPVVRPFADAIRQSEGSAPTPPWEMTDKNNVNIFGSRQILTTWLEEPLWSSDSMLTTGGREELFRWVAVPGAPSDPAILGGATLIVTPEMAAHGPTAVARWEPRELNELSNLTLYALAIAASDQTFGPDPVWNSPLGSRSVSAWMNATNNGAAFLRGVSSGVAFASEADRTANQAWLGEWLFANWLKTRSGGSAVTASDVRDEATRRGLTDITDEPWLQAHQDAFDAYLQAHPPTNGVQQSAQAQTQQQAPVTSTPWTTGEKVAAVAGGAGVLGVVVAVARPDVLSGLFGGARRK
jgi:hypothetical protein